jgi:hypothetical protein
MPSEYPSEPYATALSATFGIFALRHPDFSCFLSTTLGKHNPIKADHPFFFGKI